MGLDYGRHCRAPLMTDIFAGGTTREKLVRLEWRTRLRSEPSDLNYIRAPRAVALLEFAPHLQIRISIDSYSLTHTHTHTHVPHALAHTCKMNVIKLGNIRAAFVSFVSKSADFFFH